MDQDAEFEGYEINVLETVGGTELYLGKMVITSLENLLEKRRSSIVFFGALYNLNRIHKSSSQLQGVVS